MASSNPIERDADAAIDALFELERLKAPTAARREAFRLVVHLLSRELDLDFDLPVPVDEAAANQASLDYLAGICPTSDEKRAAADGLLGQAATLEAQGQALHQMAANQDWAAKATAEDWASETKAPASKNWGVN